MSSNLYKHLDSPHQSHRGSSSSIKPYGRDRKIYHTIRDVDIEYSAKKRSHGELDDWDKFENEIAKHLEGVSSKSSIENTKRKSKADYQLKRGRSSQKHQMSSKSSPQVISSDEDDAVREETKYLEERLQRLQQRLAKKSHKDDFHSPERSVNLVEC